MARCTFHEVIRVADRCVALDHVVVRPADQHLGIARIRERVVVGEMHPAAARRIAGNRAVVAHQRAPEEGHQPGAPRLGGRRPEPPVDRLIVETLVRFQLRRNDRGIESAEDFLDPRAVEGDEDDRRRRRLRQSRDDRGDGDQDGEEAQACHGPGF
jgi:hypothetical protein